MVLGCTLAPGSGQGGIWDKVIIVSQPIICSYGQPPRCISSFQVLVTTLSLLGLCPSACHSSWPPVVHTVSFLSWLEGSLASLALSGHVDAPFDHQGCRRLQGAFFGPAWGCCCSTRWLLAKHRDSINGYTTGQEVQLLGFEIPQSYLSFSIILSCQGFGLRNRA